MRLAVAGAVVCALLLAGCGGGGGAKQPSAAEIVSQTTTKTAAVRSFHFALKVENAPASSSGGLSLSRADGDLAVPDRLQATISGTLSGVPLESQLVIIGRRDFLKDPLSQKWREVDIKTTPLRFFDPRKGVLAILKGATALTRVGVDKVGGVDAYHLHGKVPARRVAALLGNAAASGLDPVELWVGKDDLVLRRVRVREAGGVARTVEISRLGAPVTIEAPTPSG